MPSVCKTPHGSDAMPEIIVKIIGGKHFRYLVEKPKIKHNESLKTETQTAPQNPRADNAGQMSGDLPAPTDPTNRPAGDNPDEEEESKAPDSDGKPENNQKLRTGAISHRFLDGKISHETKVCCSSAPTGDQSLSYLHGLPRRTPRDWSLEHVASSGSGQPDRPSAMAGEDSFLLSLVRRELKSHPLSPSLLDKLQKELGTLDPTSSGFLLQSQLSSLLLKHNVPLQLPTVKLLCQRLSRKSSEMVDYGKFLWFLKDITSGDLQQKESLVDSNPQKTQSHSDHRQSTAPQDASSRSNVHMSLLEVLKMVLRTTNGKLSLENLSLSFRKEDRTFSGFLPLPKVRAICGKHGLYLTLSLLETLLSHQDLGYQGEIKWQKFVELLNRASDLSCDLHAGKSEAPATPGEPDIPETSQSKTKHVKTPEEMLQPENPPAETSAPQDAVSSLKTRPVSQPFVSPAMKKDPGQHEIWIDRFRKLENALYMCDLSNTGVLEKERARRLIHNYNLIYNLSLSPPKIDQALRRFRLGENMLLEPALRYLKEL